MGFVQAGRTSDGFELAAVVGVVHLPIYQEEDTVQSATAAAAGDFVCAAAQQVGDSIHEDGNAATSFYVNRQDRSEEGTERGVQQGNAEENVESGIGRGGYGAGDTAEAVDQDVDALGGVAGAAVVGMTFGADEQVCQAACPPVPICALHVDTFQFHSAC